MEYSSKWNIKESVEGPKRYTQEKLLFFFSYCKQKYNNKKYLLILCCFHSKDHPRRPTWTLDFAPAFLQRFSFPLSPRSNFPPGQRFPLPNHVTSGCLSPRSLFTTGQRFPLPNHVTSGCLSPRSLFTTGQRFPIPLPVMTSLDQSEARKSTI